MLRCFAISRCTNGKPARDAGATVRWLDIDTESGKLRLDQLPALLGPRTRLVAVGGASNALGTLNAALAAQIWPQVVSFLKDHLR